MSLDYRRTPNNPMKSETMEADTAGTQREEQMNSDEASGRDLAESKLVRIAKTVIVTSDKPGEIDDRIVSARYYNCFNYSLLPKGQTDVRLSLGITSPNPKDGKTLVASNLAVALAMSYQRKTALVDLNIQHPRVHEVFSTSLKPGLLEAFNDVTIHVSATQIEHLFVLSAGGSMARPLGLDQLPHFRDVLYSLVQEFDFVIVDMPSMDVHGFPVLFANQLTGLFVVSIAMEKRVFHERKIDDCPAWNSRPTDAHNPLGQTQPESPCGDLCACGFHSALYRRFPVIRFVHIAKARPLRHVVQANASFVHHAQCSYPSTGTVVCFFYRW
jgi:Mrp family chromosome partitioning ATPase